MFCTILFILLGFKRIRKFHKNPLSYLHMYCCYLYSILAPIHFNDWVIIWAIWRCPCCSLTSICKILLSSRVQLDYQRTTIYMDRTLRKFSFCKFKLGEEPPNYTPCSCPCLNWPFQTSLHEFRFLSSWLSNYSFADFEFTKNWFIKFTVLLKLCPFNSL